jgi:hypothetical protein
MVMLFEAFHMCEDADDKFKLGLVMLVECIFKPVGRYIDHKTLGMVEHLEQFLMYPWGRVSYFVLLNSLRRPHRMQQTQQTERKYSLHGFPLAFQVFKLYILIPRIYEIFCFIKYLFPIILQCWIYEAFPMIGQQFGRRRHRTLQCPRMHKWKPNKFLTEKTVREFLAFLTSQQVLYTPMYI